MIRKHYWLTENSSPQRLDLLLDAYWSPLEPRLSRSKIKKLILAGGVRINGRVSRICSRMILKGTNLEVSFNETALFETQKLKAPSISILYEDHSLLIINKPAGLPTQPTVDPLRPNLYSLLKEKIKPYLGLHHRLDRDTSGVLLFTKDKSVNRSIAEQFKSRLIKKTYLALVEGPSIPKKRLRSTWKITKSLKAIRIRGIQHMETIEKGGQDAETHFELLGKHATYALMRAKPVTGRMHQIRAHLAFMGCPIVGDTSYHSKKIAPRILLHAFSLSLHHPKTDKPLCVEAPLPEDFLHQLNMHHLSHLPIFSK